MFEARRVIEESLASLAAQRATGEQMAALAEVIAAMYASLGDPQQYLIHDIRIKVNRQRVRPSNELIWEGERTKRKRQ